MHRIKRNGKFELEYVIYPITICAVLIVVSSFTGLWVTEENPYRSYTLQACAWIEGRLDLGADYPWLELAIYDGKYYVSFPPFPSFVMLPFAMVFGVNTPDHLISLIFTLMGVIYALRLYKLHSGSLKLAEYYVLFLYFANGYIFIAMQGWVWYLAQCMCFTLSLMALYYASTGRGGTALTCWACAVGCRPMIIVYLPLLLMILVRKWDEMRGINLVRLIQKKWYWALPTVFIAVIYMMLNYERFGDPFEFGHNYLPEFLRAEKGQFSLSYIPKNLELLLRLPQGEIGKEALTYHTFDCMAFWLIAPMSIVYAIVWMQAVLSRRRVCQMEWVTIPLMLLLHLLIICSHRTLGGYQFGNRYIVDMLPYVFYGLLRIKPENRRFELLILPLFVMGFSINLIGTVATYNHWMS